MRMKQLRRTKLPRHDRFLITTDNVFQELADALELGSRFYVAATSIGGYTGYSLLKYLPHRSVCPVGAVCRVTQPL